MKWSKLALSLALSLCFQRALLADDTYANIDPARVSAIEAMLPVNPAGFGSPITDRVYWTGPTAASLTKGTLSNASKYLADGLANTADPTALRNLVLAECFENQGRFLPLIAQELEIFLARTDWGIAFGRSSDCGDIATALYLLATKLDSDLQSRCLTALRSKCFDGLYAVMKTGTVTAYNDWVKADDNWSAVCWDQVVCAVTSVPTDRHHARAMLRARIITLITTEIALARMDIAGKTGATITTVCLASLSCVSNSSIKQEALWNYSLTLSLPTWRRSRCYGS